MLEYAEHAECQTARGGATGSQKHVSGEVGPVGGLRGPVTERLKVT